MIVETGIAAGSLARLLQPLIKDIYEGAKRLGARGFTRWEQKTFPAKLSRRIKSLENVRTLWKPEPLSLQEFFHPPKLVIEEKPTFLSRLAQLPSNAVVIQGIVGQGKSVFLRSLAVEEIRSNDAKRLPIFLELKDLSAKANLTQALIKQFESYDIDFDDASLEFFFRSGKAALLLDGFDELEEALVKQTYLDIEHLILRYPELLVVVTCRPGHEIQKSSAFTILQIAKLTPAEYPAFLAKLGVNSEKSQSLRQAIKNSPSKISNLITTPLMLTLVVIVYEAESQLPETLPEFFDRLFQVVFSRHDRLKAAFTRKHHSGLSERLLQELFEAFCFMTLQAGYGRTLTSAQFEEVFDLALDYADNCKCEAEKFKQDIIKVACLMLEDGIDSVTFLHKSILEYYAAAFVRRLGEENSHRFYQSAMERLHGWEEVLRYLKSIDPFRYSRHYVLPVIADERRRLLLPITEDSSDNTLIELLESIYPEMGVYFRLDQEERGRARISAYGAFMERPADYLGGFGFLYMDALSESVPTLITAEELQDRFHAHPENAPTEHGSHVSAKRLLKEYGTKQVRLALATYGERLQKVEQEALTVVQREEKKKLIFDRKRRS